jgi:hypothetical protein
MAAILGFENEMAALVGPRDQPFFVVESYLQVTVTLIAVKSWARMRLQVLTPNESSEAASI